MHVKMGGWMAFWDMVDEAGGREVVARVCNVSRVKVKWHRCPSSTLPAALRTLPHATVSSMNCVAAVDGLPPSAPGTSPPADSAVAQHAARRRAPPEACG
jgi:hypothetical protein